MIGCQNGADNHEFVMQHTEIPVRWDLLKNVIVSFENPAAPSMGWPKAA
jgi:hypothetical protein